MIIDNNQPIDDYLLHRGRLSELSFLFLQPQQQEGMHAKSLTKETSLNFVC